MVLARFLKELVVRAALYYSLLADDDDFVRALNGGEAVGDDDNRSALGELLESRLNLHFGGVIEGAGCLIEDKKLRIL